MRRGLALLALALSACQTPGPTGPTAGVGLPAALAAPPPLQAGRPGRIVVVSVAGLDTASLLAAGPGLPVLAALVRGGAVAERVEPVAPASAYPVHTTFVTGRSPGEHGVPADRRLGRNGVRRALHAEASGVRGDTLWQIAAADGVPVAALDWPATLGAAIPLLLPDVVPTRRGETWQGLLLRTTTPWLYEQVAARKDPTLGRPGAARDALLVDLACGALAAPRPPRLTLLRLRQLETALEDAGSHAPATSAALAGVDRELGRLVRCLDAAGRFADAALVVLGDRALLPVHTVVHPNAVLAEAGLVGEGRGPGGSAWRAIARSNGGSAFVYASDEQAALAARAVLTDEAAASRIFRVVPAGEMILRGADPDAWFGLEAEPGYVFGDSAAEPRQRPAARRAAGGQLAGAGSPAFVAYGRGIRPGLRIPQLRQLDVAPTLAELLGLPLASAQGRPLVGLLASPGVGAAGGAGPEAGREASP